MVRGRGLRVRVAAGVYGEATDIVLRFVVYIERIEQWLCPSRDVLDLLCDFSIIKVCVQVEVFS